MSLKELKSQFLKELSGIYPSEEVQSFFNMLSQYLLNYSRLDTVLKSAKIISEENQEQFKKATLRLKQFEPIQYIIGETEFFGLPFKVTPATLIPRPETEELVQWIVDEYLEASQNEPLHFLDIGTGSGCIAIALAHNVKQAHVSAVDFSPQALQVAESNAQTNKASITFFELDVLKNNELPRKYDVIVSNPPYVRDLEKKMMQPNVLLFEPDSALFVSDEDPLLFYRKIAELGKRYLTQNGRLFFEINEYLSKELVELLAAIGFSEIKVRNDIFGKKRMLNCKLIG